MSRKASIVNLCPCILTRGRLKHIGTEGNDVPLYKLIVPRESKKMISQQQKNRGKV